MDHPTKNHKKESQENVPTPLDPVAQVMVDWALELAVGNLRDMLREQLGNRVERITKEHFEYIGDIPTGIPVAENEIIYAFRKVGAKNTSLLVATFEKSEDDMPNTLNFKGTRLFPDTTMQIH